MELAVANGLLLRGSRVVVPKSLQKEILEKLHAGHQGITKYWQRAKDSVWWPGIRKDIDKIVTKCETCCKVHTQCPERLLPNSTSVQTMAEGQNRPIWMEKEQLYPRSWLLLEVHRSSETSVNDSNTRHHTPKIDLLTTRDSRNSNVGQQTSILVSSLQRVCQRVRVWTHNK